jgi:hypothetical protein
LFSHGPLVIDESFANLRAPVKGGKDGAVAVHTGRAAARVQYYHLPTNGGEHRQPGTSPFVSGMVNMALALDDIGPGDGATVLIAGSHKSLLPHPALGDSKLYDPAVATEDFTEIHMNAGDVLLFVDALTHGSAVRTNPGLRKSIWYRYSSAWNRLRYGYAPSKELLARLTPLRRAIVAPQADMMLPMEPQVAVENSVGGEPWTEDWVVKQRR